MVNFTWTQSGVRIPAPGDGRIMESFVPPMGSLLEYESALELSFLISEDSSQYLCNPTIESLSNNPFVEPVQATIAANITVQSEPIKSILYSWGPG